jgi:hypothetical protein
MFKSGRFFSKNRQFDRLKKRLFGVFWPGRRSRFPVPGGPGLGARWPRKHDRAFFSVAVNVSNPTRKHDRAFLSVAINVSNPTRGGTNKTTSLRVAQQQTTSHTTWPYYITPPLTMLCSSLLEETIKYHLHNANPRP